MKSLKWLLVILAALCPSITRAQQFQFTAPDCEFSFRYAVVNNAVVAPARIPAQAAQVGPVAQVTAGYDNRYKNCVSWTLEYHVDGPSALSIELDEAPTSSGVPGSWAIWPSAFVAPGTALPLTSTGSSQVSAFTYFPWISVILNSATGNGQVEGHVYGWRPAAGQDASTAGVSVAAVSTDPCQSSAVTKFSVPINISTAATTQLLAPSGTTTTFVCGFTFTISEVATTANTLQFIVGTGGACGGATVTKSGLFGAGGVTAGDPILVSSGGGAATVFSAVPLSGVCAVTAIGATGSFQGILTYVQK